MNHRCVLKFISARVFVCVSAEVKKESEEGDEPRAETESESEEELSCFAPTVRVAAFDFSHAAPGHRLQC